MAFWIALTICVSLGAAGLFATLDAATSQLIRGR